MPCSSENYQETTLKCTSARYYKSPEVEVVTLEPGRPQKNTAKMANEVVEEYKSTLAELTFNSKPHINMLTMLADDYREHATEIVQAIEQHIKKVYILRLFN